MMGPVEKLLATSAQLYEHLTVIPDGDERDQYIEKIDEFLEKRGQLLEEVMSSNNVSLDGHQLTPHLIKLDAGIQGRLKKVMEKSEQVYLNPYSNVSSVDGRYYDGKK